MNIPAAQPSVPAFPPGVHEAVAALATGDATAAMQDLVAALRPVPGLPSNAGLEALRHLLENYPQYRAALRGLLLRHLGDDSAAMLYAESGILANTGFFTELGRRIIGKLLPPACDDNLRGLVRRLFDGGEHGDWLAGVAAADWHALYVALHVEEEPAAAWRAGWHAVLDGLDMLSVRVAALGVEPELLRHYRVPRDQHNPFLAQNTEVQQWLAAVRQALLDGDSPALDGRQVAVLLEQCAKVADAVRRSAHRSGASFALTFLLRRLEQSLARMNALVGLVEARFDAGADATAVIDSRLAFMTGLLVAEGLAHDVREHLRRNTELVALQVTEQASRTGEHYVTSTRAEYFAMLRSALGAGAIIGVMALLKVLLAQAHLPPLLEAMAFSLNYGLGFVLIFILHFSIATKQPAMTAQTIAASLTATRGRVDVQAVGLLVSRVARTQFIAIVGNVALALPVALLATWALVTALAVEAPAAKSAGLIADLHPWQSLALLHAAIAGVWLFVAGLASGYIDNLAAYERFADRVRRVRWLGRLLGAERRDRFAAWLEENIGGISGNFLFGVLLGTTGFVGYILGLPLDIRHVTFSVANVAIAWVGSGYALPAGVLALAALGVLLIALVNVAVSFSLALLIALRARGQQVSNGPELLAAIGARFRHNPAAFFLPPREEKTAPGAESPP